MSWGRLRVLLWSPAREGEGRAQSNVRVLGNLSRWAALIAFVLGTIIWQGALFREQIKDRPVRITELAGVEIGMPPYEVTRVKGAGFKLEPTRRADGSWDQMIVIGDLLVLLDGPSEDDLTVHRVCETEPGYETDVNGIKGWESEKSVLRRLGRPTMEVADEDGPGKSSYFERYNLMIRFSQSRVRGICVGV